MPLVSSITSTAERHFNRRQALAFGGTVAVTGLPAMALAAVDPDSELIRLGRQYRTLADAKAAAENRLEAVRDVYTAQRPTIPDDIGRLGYERWRLDCDRLADRIGFTAAQADVDRLDAEMWAIRAAIAKIPARADSRIRIKARIIAQQFGVEGVLDPAVADSLLIDLGGRTDG